MERNRCFHPCPDESRLVKRISRIADGSGILPGTVLRAGPEGADKPGGKQSRPFLLAETPRYYERGELGVQQFPPTISPSVFPMQMLANRPDVRSAERTLEAAFYGTNQARSAFYPSITLSGSAGWTNNVGSMIVNPGKFLASAVGSLTQPLFARGGDYRPVQDYQAATGRGGPCLPAIIAECRKRGK